VVRILKEEAKSVPKEEAKSVGCFLHRWWRRIVTLWANDSKKSGDVPK